MQSFRELKVWQKSIEFVTEVYRLTEKFTKGELYGLTSQIRKAAVAIPSNIAERHNRNNIKEYLQFLYIARSSAAEVATQLQIASNLEFLPDSKFKSASENLDEIQRMLSGLISKLRTIKFKTKT